jgi:hypothetical protein
MPLKHWSFAGLMLTYWCNARCDSCYLACDPGRQDWMPVDLALNVWRSLVRAGPRGCRIHLTGGEPFGNWPLLLEICRRAHDAGLAPLEKIETNAFWADDERSIVDRLGALDAAGMGTLSISTDPYHQRYVPIERCRLLARLAEDILGADRVQIRWRDWLADGSDTAHLDATEWRALVTRYAASGRDRLSGRAADLIAPHLPGRPAECFANSPCREAILRSRHVHVDPAGRIMPGVCAGIVLGRFGPQSVDEIWHGLDADCATRPIISTLAREGPVGLLPDACAAGFIPHATYAAQCHLCWHVRKHHALAGRHREILAPEWLYR